MDTRAYPGSGLSLSQLVFALSEELKNAAHSPSTYVDFTHPSFLGTTCQLLLSLAFDDVSQIEQDISTVLTTTREWRNSFVHINRIPSDVLSLIPTHLFHQKDRFRASFVCRHWRRTFLQHAVLWSKLYLSKGETYMKTLLERAKGSALDITTNSRHPVGTVMLLPPHTTQLEHINFERSHWKDIRTFSEINSGPLPLLRTLTIRAVHESGPNIMTPPSLPLFCGAINLKELSLSWEGQPFLNHFVFPNLTVLQLSASSEVKGLRASQLLDFLEASPMLQSVRVEIFADILLGGISRERVVVLPNVMVFTLTVDNGETGYEMAAHISCPSAMHTSLMCQMDDGAIPVEVFPNSVSWNTIVRQYTKNPVEEVAFEIDLSRNSISECSLTFRSPDAAVLTLRCQVIPSGNDEEILVPFAEMHCKIIHQAFRTIRDHPFLANVKRLQVSHRVIVCHTPEFPRFAAEVRQLFESVGPLEKLTTYGCDPHLYPNPSLNSPGFPNTERQVVFPQIRELVISHPALPYNIEGYMANIVELARSQHMLGIPFERMTLRMERISAAMVERLRPWVSVVECHEEMRQDDGY